MIQAAKAFVHSFKVMCAKMSEQLCDSPFKRDAVEAKRATESCGLPAPSNSDPVYGTTSLECKNGGTEGPFGCVCASGFYGKQCENVQALLEYDIQRMVQESGSATNGIPVALVAFISIFVVL
jgi:hypothetical protein